MHRPISVKAFMKQLILLASFPKSGNTWVRLFLSSYLSGATSEVLMQDMKIGMVERAVTFRTVMGMPFTHETSTGLWGDYVTKLPDSMAGNIQKTHLPRTTMQGTPLFPGDARVIHIVRNPFDIVPSLARHNGRSIDDAVLSMVDPQSMLKVQYDIPGQPGNFEEGSMPLGDWASHTLSWQRHPGEKLLLRYEDLKKDAEAGFTKLLEFLGMQVDENRMKFALEQTELSTLTANEAKVGFIERNRNTSAPFFGGSLTAPSAESQMSDTQKAAFRSSLGELMDALGY